MKLTDDKGNEFDFEYTPAEAGIERGVLKPIKKQTFVKGGIVYCIEDGSCCELYLNENGDYVDRRGHAVLPDIVDWKQWSRITAQMIPECKWVTAEKSTNSSIVCFWKMKPVYKIGWTNGDIITVITLNITLPDYSNAIIEIDRI